ncbi:AMP-binding protein [Endozoicomonadaceae bacterium StTr2]
MNNVLTALKQHALSRPEAVALAEGKQHLTWQMLWQRVQQAAETLQQHQVQRLALAADNGIGWVVTDLACLLNGTVCVPVPPFFSEVQVNHLLAEAGVDGLLAGNLSTGVVLGEIEGMALARVGTGVPPELPQGCQKITFTSGSTGNPKGVCLSAKHQQVTAAAITEVISDVKGERHLCLLPLSTLLENIAGIYVPLLRGMCIEVSPMAQLGLNGSSSLDLPVMLQAISRIQPDSVILTPQILLGLVIAAERGWVPPASLTFIAVGGGRVSPELLQRATALGLPVYEGYGLSECGSVVSLNTPAARRAGSTGQPLPHCRIEIDNGEVVVKGAAFLGYLGATGSSDDTVHTGDIGHLDKGNFLHITGRRKNLLISSFGRNISPEWPESELLQTGLFSHCVVVGDAKPFCVALCQLQSGVSNEAVDNTMARINRELPDYARIKQWAPLPENHLALGAWTANGRPRREVINQICKQQIEQLYTELKECEA